MSSMSLFLVFVPILALILLFINLAFASHNPYPEKNNVFECGFTSFLGQNRTQFSISFFIFALLFLLFDLEILLVYPYLVSAYTNETYGLTVILIFLLALTLGFAFELGKKALSIDSRQTTKAHHPSIPHALVDLSLQSNLLSVYILCCYKFLVKFFKLLKKTVLYLFNYVVSCFKSLRNKTTYYLAIITKKIKLSNVITGLFTTVSIIVIRYTGIVQGYGLLEYLFYGLPGLCYRFTLGVILEHEFNKLGININFYEFLFGCAKSCSPIQSNILPDSGSAPNRGSVSSPSPGSDDDESENSPSLNMQKIAELPIELREPIHNEAYKVISEADKSEALAQNALDISWALHYLSPESIQDRLKDKLEKLASSEEAVREEAAEELERDIKFVNRASERAEKTLKSLAEKRKSYSDSGWGKPWRKDEDKVFDSAVKRMVELPHRSTLQDKITQSQQALEEMRNAQASPEAIVKREKEHRQLLENKRLRDLSTILDAGPLYKDKRVQVHSDIAEAVRSLEEYKARKNAQIESKNKET